MLRHLSGAPFDKGSTETWYGITPDIDFTVWRRVHGCEMITEWGSRGCSDMVPIGRAILPIYPWDKYSQLSDWSKEGDILCYLFNENCSTAELAEILRIPQVIRKLTKVWHAPSLRLIRMMLSLGISKNSEISRRWKTDAKICSVILPRDSRTIMFYLCLEL